MTTAVTLLYDDEAMAAVMKPAGVAIVPAPGVVRAWLGARWTVEPPE